MQPFIDMNSTELSEWFSRKFKFNTKTLMAL